MEPSDNKFYFVQIATEKRPHTVETHQQSSIGRFLWQLVS